MSYVNKKTQTTGEHVIHTDRCNYLRDIQNKLYLGNFRNCKEAIEETKKYYLRVDGCYYCAKEGHKKN